MKENKGITLVALIITIIVMMILVAVTVAVIINSDLLGTAQEAGRSYKENADAEGNLSGDDVQITVGGETYYSIDEYVKGKCTHESFDAETDDECPDCGIAKIEFTFANFPQVALEGMTWADWAKTNWIYTSHGLWEIVMDNGNVCISHKTAGYIIGYVATSENVRVQPTDIITNGTTYVGEF